mgnify:FL=1
MMFRWIGYRTLKTVISAVCAMYIAYFIGLPSYTPAGLIAIISVQNTTKKSLDYAVQRFIAAFVGLLLAAVTFYFFGFEIWAIGLFMLVWIPTAVRLKVTEGIVVTVVGVSRVYTVESISFETLSTEILNLFIGITVALIANLYMPNVETEIKKTIAAVEENYRKILNMMARTLRKEQENFEMGLFDDTTELLKKGRNQANLNVQNTIMNADTYYVSYFSMRKKQFEILKHIVEELHNVHKNFEQVDMIADFLDRTAECLGEKNNGQWILMDLRALKGSFKEMALPETREEFETRAVLYNVLVEIERFIQTKLSFVKDVTPPKTLERTLDQ